MTRKDYVLIAQALKSSDNHPNRQSGGLVGDSIDSQFQESCLWVADALQQDNPAFNRAKFLEACGV